MDKPVAVIEIADSALKLAVGYVIDREPVIIYALKRPIQGLLEAGEIVNFPALIDALGSLKSIRDQEAKIKLTVSEATLVLPPLGFEIYENEKTTNVVSPTSIIEGIDIQNVISLVKKEAVSTGNEVVDIIPDIFVLEEGRQFANPPIGEKSNSLTIYAKIHTLPRHVVDDYRRVLHEAGIRVKRAVISPFAVSDLAAAMKEKPKTYVLIDMGAQLTTFTLICENSPFGSTYLKNGGEKLTEAIMRNFGLAFDAAEQLKIKYGLDERELSFAPAISKVTDADGVVHEYTLKDLNAVTSAFLKDYFDEFGAALDTIFAGYGEEVRSLPLVFTGGMSELHGIREVIGKRFAEHKDIHYLCPEAIGARSAGMAGVVGGLLASTRYRGALSDQRAKVAQVERVKEGAGKAGENKR